MFVVRSAAVNRQNTYVYITQCIVYPQLVVTTIDLVLSNDVIVTLSILELLNISGVDTLKDRRVLT